MLLGESMLLSESWLETDDGSALFLRRWQPPKDPPAAVLNVAHGMAEHAGRYERLAAKLAGGGIALWAADMRGHGKTADSSVNAPGRGGLRGHACDSGGFSRISADVRAVHREIEKTHPGVPLFLLGHSWGSFIALDYIEKYPQDGLSGCILSGTAGPAKGLSALRVNAGVPVMALLAFLHKKRGASRLAKNLADGPYNKFFKPQRTDFDWLSRDEAEVDAYIQDPGCGFLCSSGFYYDLARGFAQVFSRLSLSKIEKSLPVYIFSGSADPVGGMGAGPLALAAELKTLGLGNLELALYPDVRHEPLNETNREEVMENLLSWIMRQLPGQLPVTPPKE